MGQLAELAIPFVIFLIAINAMFMAAGTLPGGQFAGDAKLFSSITDNNSMHDYMTSYITDVNGNITAMHTPSDSNSNVVVSTTGIDVTAIIFNILNGATGGGLGYVVTLVNWFLQLAFGYGVWIDYFLNPAWHPFFFYAGGILKGFFLVVQLYAIVAIFTALAGR